MPIKGVYTALSGAIAQSTKLDTIANNIANVNTPGFKRDQQVFAEYLTANEKEPTTIPIPRDVAAIESFYNMQGGDKSYVHEKGTYTDFSQGSLKRTGGALDVAIDGPGFFEVDSPQGSPQCEQTWISVAEAVRAGRALVFSTNSIVGTAPALWEPPASPTARILPS